MAGLSVSDPLAELDQSELKRVAGIAGKLLAGRSSTMSGGRPHRRQAGRGLEFFDHRPYQPGDEVRHIDWRQSARRPDPMVRRFVHEASTDWLIALDCSASMASASACKWHLGLQLAAAMSYVLLYLGDRVAVAAFSEELDAICRPGRGAGHYTRLLRVLGDLNSAQRGTGSRPGACAPLARRCDAAIVITDGLVADAMQNDLGRLAALCGHLQLMQLQDRDDTRLPLSTNLRLVDVESRRGRSVRSTPALIEAAAARHREHAARLHKFCVARDIRHTAIDARTHWRDAILRHLLPAGMRGA